MEEFTLVVFQRAPSDYPESNWQEIFIINNEDEYFEALKETYLRDAHTRNDYPICSFDLGYIYTYENLQEYNHSGSLYHRDLRYLPQDKELKTKAMETYHYAESKFEKWKSKIRSLIPRIRNIAREKERETNEIKRLFELAKKYGYDLHKVL